MAAATLTLVVLAGACGDDSSPRAVQSDATGTSAVTDSTGAPTTTAVPTTLAATTTTAAPTTTAPATTIAPATTVPVTAADLVLRSDGVGPLTFGTDAAAVLATLLGVFGTPARQSTGEYLVDVGDGTFQTPDGESGFVFPYGSSACYGVGFCVQFGGAEPTTLHLTGWWYDGASTPPLATAEGITLESRWSDFPSIVREPGGCYTVGWGAVDGVGVWMLSSGEMFSGPDAAGNWVDLAPDPALVTVTRMEAGDLEIGLYGDC